MITPAIWTAIYAELPLHEAFRALHAYGWRAFEISTEHLAAIETGRDLEGSIAKARDCLHGLGLEAPQAHACLEADVADPDAAARKKDIGRLLCHIGIAARLGARHVVMHPGGRKAGAEAGPDVVRRLNVEAFRRLGDYAGEHGVRIGLENMMRPGAATPAELLDLLAVIDHPALGVAFDTSHANVAALDIAACIRAYGSHLVATHISDNNGTGDQHLTPGNGTIDWPAAMAALGETGYDGLLNLEIPGERHRVPSLLELKLRHALEVARWLAGLAEEARKEKFGMGKKRFVARVNRHDEYESHRRW
ncbi:MAG: sugar phosphate isomerase/epimerase family protein [Patescibacteria group bacterium]